MIGSTKFKGIIKLFGIFEIKRDLCLELEIIPPRGIEPNPYLFNNQKIKILEPFLRKICTISWVRS